jgi:hypothetical protein
MRRRTVALRSVLTLVLVMLASHAVALPITLRDSNGTRYNINTDVSPVPDSSLASGAVTDATFEKPVTVTSYFVGFTFFGFTTVYTVQRQINIPLRNAFAGFNGLVLTAINGQALGPRGLLYNPGEALASEDCSQNGANRQLNFQPQTFPNVNLQVTRKVFVPNNGEFLRWLNVITNTGPTAMNVSVALRGQLGSDNETRITSTSTGDSGLSPAVQWFTTAQQTPKGTNSTQPKLGFVVQGAGASPPPTVAIGSQGQTVFTYSPLIQPGQSVSLLTFVTVQGSTKNAKSTVQNLVTLPAKGIFCLSQQELQSVVNFAPVTQPETKKATITLNFKKTAADTVKWNGMLTIGAGISLQGLPVTIDVGGASQTFVLNKSGKANNGGGNNFKLQAKLAKGVTKAGPIKFSFQLKGDFKAIFAEYGLTDATVKNVPVTVPVSFTAAKTFATAQGFSYTATQGKKGTAKSS